MVTSYPLGAVPPLTVYRGEGLSIVLKSRVADATFSLSPDGPRPNGILALDASTGVLNYTPAVEDRAAFTVTLRAQHGNDREEQKVRITPMTPPEFNVIEHRTIEKQRPDPEAFAYITFVEQKAATKEIFNNETDVDQAEEEKAKINTSSVIVSGVRLVLERSEKYPLFKRLDGSKEHGGRTDLKQLTLCADEVIVRSPLNLPGTDVHIHARRLCFEKDGAIITTPRAVTVQATQRMEGFTGQRAGNVSLFVRDLETPGTTVRIITTGGNGQPAKRGVAGDAGGDMTAWNGHSETPKGFGTYGLNWDRTAGGYEPVYVEVGYKTYNARTGITSWTKTETFGDKRWPSSGTDPKSYPGRPGHGGSGGSIVSSFKTQLESRTERKAGTPGKRADPVNTARAGTPQRACWAKAVYDNSDWFKNKVVGYDIIETHETHAGKDAPVPDADPAKAPKSGELTLPERAGTGDWLHPAAVRAVISYTHDVMLAGYAEDARDRLTQYDRTLADALKAGGVLSGASETNVEWPGLHSEIGSLLQRIDSPYDYFGNPAGWVPMLSFEANLKLYENEIKEAIHTMYLAYWIENRQDRTQKAAATLERAITSLAAETAQAEKDAADAIAKLGSLEVRCSEIATQMGTLESKRVARMKVLEEAAENSQRFENLLRGAGKLLGAVMQMAPVAQPALGAFGKGLTALSDFDPDHPGKIVPGLAGAFGDLAKEKLTAKLKPLFESIKDAKVEIEDDESKDDQTNEKDEKKRQEKREIEKGIAKKKLAAKVKKKLDEEKAAKDQIVKAFSDFAVSEDQLAERLAQMAADCPEYQELLEEIKALNDKKAGFTTELLATLQLLDQACHTLLINQQGHIELRSQLDHNLAQLNLDALQYVRGMGQRARQRLLRYQYYLLKSYHYFMLRDQPEIDFRAQKVVDEFAAMLSPEGKLTDAQYGLLRGVFDDQLKQIVEKIIAEFQERGFAKEGDFQVQLSDTQLRILNETHELTLDFMQMAAIDLQFENVRMISVATEDIGLTGLPAKAVTLSFEYEHDGISNLRAAGRLYQFRSGASAAKGQPPRMFWGTNIDCTPGKDPKRSEMRVDQEIESLIGHLIDKAVGNDKEKRRVASLLSYRPGAWARITVRCPNPNFTYTITKLVLKVGFVANLVDRELASVLVRMSHDVERGIQCSAYDLNRRSDGSGTFLRTYPRKTTITLEAPAAGFEGWEIAKGEIQPKPGLALKLDKTSYIAKARFVKAADS